MKKTKKSISSFNLSFLDIMFCGFGAVVLLVLIINNHIVTDNKIKNEDLTAEVDKVKEETKAAKIYHRNMKNTLEEKQAEIERLKKEFVQINDETSDLQIKKTKEQQQSQALQDHINVLQNDIKAMDKKTGQQKKKLETAIKESGNKVRQYEGDGHRQYLTGLKLGGKRILFLIDSSASMLDETIVNIIVKRNLSNSVKRSARKWRQAINSLQWMVANLPANSQLAVVSFNTNIQSLATNNSFNWIKSTDTAQVNGLFNKLEKLVPEKGTNLRRAFSAIKKLPQKPDNIILITDGLPTQGNSKTNKSKITSLERVKLFEKAAKSIPKYIPVNTILLPMEGDPMAAVLFWKLAINTKGSFITPSRDWP
ncbi:MAG: VWA domain-containing protein [Gammaproteobacteria bacterium]|nr:VWA domain-containing protein [Gammaproteobacteria bacterium]